MLKLSNQWKEILDADISGRDLTLENFRKLDICTSLQLPRNISSSEIIAHIDSVKDKLCKHLEIGIDSDLDTICTRTAESVRVNQNRRWEANDNFE